MTLIAAFTFTLMLVAAPVDDAPVLERMQLRLQEAQSRVEARRARWKTERGSLEDEVTALGSEVVALRIQVERARAKLKLERAAFDQGREQYNATEAAAERATLALNTLADRIGITASETPLGHGLPAGIVPRFRALHQLARSADIGTRELRIADGSLAAVQCVRVGLVACAYKRDTGAIGFALNSPADASGYRFNEALAPPLVDQLQLAFTERASLPIDVTGRLRVEAISTQQGLVDRVRSGGPVMIPLAMVALVALFLFLERIVILARSRGAGATLLPSLLDLCQAKRFDDAEQMLVKARGTPALALAACLSRRCQGTAAMENGIQEVLLREVPRLERFLGGLALLGAVAPLLGLLGTVTGIIATFAVLQESGGGEPGLFAGGISEALVTTATGLIVAIPILLAHGFLSGRVDRIVAESEASAATLLTRLSDGSAE